MPIFHFLFQIYYAYSYESDRRRDNKGHAEDQSDDLVKSQSNKETANLDFRFLIEGVNFYLKICRPYWARPTIIVIFVSFPHTQAILPNALIFQL